MDIYKSRMVGKMPLDCYFYTHCRIDSFHVLRQSFCGKFKIFCGFQNPRNPLFRMYACFEKSVSCQTNLRMTKEHEQGAQFCSLSTNSTNFTCWFMIVHLSFISTGFPSVSPDCEDTICHHILQFHILQFHILQFHILQFHILQFHILQLGVEQISAF